MSERIPQSVRDGMEYVICGPEMNTHVQAFCGIREGTLVLALNLDGRWNFEKFKEGFQIQITRLNKEAMEFDLVGVHASIANALRRIIIAEVPTMAIEHVFFIDNTGVVQDEVLAHRLGLIPIAADPRLFEWKRDDESSNERNCIVFKLDVECIKLKRDLNHSSGATGVITRLTECIVLSADLKWLPDGSEMPDETNCRFTASQSTSLLQNGAPVEIKTVHDDILLTKLQTRQVIQLEAHCFKGVGKDHAKWSPVATAWYRLRPEVVLLKEISGKKAQFLAEQFKGLFITETKEGTDTEIAKVSETRGNEVYLEQIRRLSGEPDWEKKIQLRKQKDYFLYTIESVGQYTPEDIFSEAVDVLIHKCDKLIAAL